MVLGRALCGRWGVVGGLSGRLLDGGAILYTYYFAFHLQLTTYHSLLTTYLLDEGHEVAGDALRVLSDEAALVRAHRVEVSQQHDVPRAVRPGEG